MHSPGVEDNDGVLGDKLTFIGKVFSGNVGSAKPERVVAAFDLNTKRNVSCILCMESVSLKYLFYNGMAVRQVLFIFNCGQSVSPYHSVQFSLRFFLYLRVCWY